MSRFRTQKLEESGGLQHALGLEICPAEESRRRLGWRFAVNRRTGSSAIAIRLDELDHGMSRIGPRGETSAAVHLALQRSEERIRHGVAVAITGTAA